MVECERPVWKSLCEKFKSNVTGLGVPFFRQCEAVAEQEFVRFCETNNIAARRKVLLEYTGRGTLESAYYYLSVRDTGEYAQDFIELRCGGAGPGMCWNGAKQVRKVTVTDGMARMLDANEIVVKNYPIFPRTYVVTSRLVERMLSLHFRGIAFIPCLQQGSDYSEDERSFDFESDRLSAAAKYFQMVIRERAPGKPSIGNLLDASACPRCGSLNVVDGSTEDEFQSSDLSDADFQWVADISTTNKGPQHLMGQIAIISQRALRFFLDGRIRGLKQYLTAPPIKYRAAQIVDAH